MKIIATEMHAPIRDVLFLKKVVHIVRRLPRCFITTVPASLRMSLVRLAPARSPRRRLYEPEASPERERWRAGTIGVLEWWNLRI